MAATVRDAAPDAYLGNVDDATEIYCCTSQATSRADAISKALNAAHAITAGAGNGDWGAITDGVVSGRRMVLGQQTITPNADGLATHYVCCTASELVTQFTINGGSGVSLVNGTARTFEAVAIEVRDPS